MGAFSQALAMANKTDRVLVDWDRFVSDRWQPVRIGEHKIYHGAARAVWDDCCRRQILDVTLAPYSETSLVAPYLAAIARGHEEPPRTHRPHLLRARPPLYYVGPTRSEEHELVYVDIDRAYHSIYTRATLDVNYDGEHAPRPGEIAFDDADALGEHKLARNALLGMLRRFSRRGLDHGMPFSEPVPADRRRPDLWALVMDVLDLVAWSARDRGALTFHVDGAIFPGWDLAESWMDWLAGFGLSGSVRASGEGYVRGLVNFRIGDTVMGEERLPGMPLDSMVPRPRAISEVLLDWLSDTKVCSSHLIPTEV